MSNNLVTCNIIAKESLAVLKNMLGFAAAVNRDFDSEFGGNQARGYSPGQTINIKKPPRYTYRAGRVSVPQSTVESTIPLTLNQGGTDLGFTGLERAVSIQQLDQKINAAVVTVVNEMDRQGLDMARLTTFNAVGTPGTPPNTQALAIAAITAAQQRLDEMGAPRDSKSRAAILNPAMNGYIVTGMAGLFNAPGAVSAQFGSGIVVPSLGLTYAMDQNVVNHVNGAATATNVNGAGQVGASITVVATAGGTLTKGSIITLPGVLQVNPQSRQSTGATAQFVVTADVLVGATSIPISPAIVTSGAFQNVTASPTTGAAYTILGAAGATYASNIIFHRDAFTLAMVPMDAPMASGGVECHIASDQGLSVKVTRYYDPINDFNGMRLDVLFGWAAPYPELATKLVA